MQVKYQLTKDVSYHHHGYWILFMYFPSRLWTPWAKVFCFMQLCFLSSSVQFSCSVMSDSLQPHELQHARPSCPSPTPAVHSNSCPLSRWCHPAISSSVVLFSSHLQSLPASGSFPVSEFLASGGQKYWSFSFSISPSNEYSGLISFRMDWFVLVGTDGHLIFERPLVL